MNTFLSSQAQSTPYKSVFADAFIPEHSPRGSADPHRLDGTDEWTGAAEDNQPRGPAVHLDSGSSRKVSVKPHVTLHLSRTGRKRL